MREIKFRAWDEVEDKMIPFNKLWLEMEDGYGGVREFDSSTGKYEECTSEFILMQYTGLKDKNGKEIYEGDIVKGKNYGFNNPQRYIGEVIYIYNRYEVKGTKQYKGIRDELNTTYEVIGNIYENPELLKN